MSDPTKIIQQFLQRNGMLQTLKTYKNETRKANNVSRQNLSSFFNINKTIIQNSQQNQHIIREHLQRTDPKYLKKFVDKMKKMPHTCENQTINKLNKLPFFNKLVQKQMQNYQNYKQNYMRKINSPNNLDQSRMYQNQWQSEDDLGYQIVQCRTTDISQVIQKRIRLKNLQQNRIKNIPFPQKYFTQWNQEAHRYKINMHDFLNSKLPQFVVFNEQNSNNLYPVQYNGTIYDSSHIKVIYDRQKTGYQSQRQIKIVINDILAGRYQVVSLLNHEGNFSRVIQVKDLASQNKKQQFCIKIIKNLQGDIGRDYLNQALDQIKILKYVRANCDTDQSSIINLYDYFYHKQHLMIVTEILKQNLLDVRQKQPEYFTLENIQSISRQILTALATLHKLNIIHNDLKPQNIVIKSYSNRLVKVIDLGSCVFFQDQLHDYVQTRYYRAPEVILGCPYTEKIDIWSFGCIIFQLFTGKVLFQAQSTAQILSKIQGIRGPWPSWMIQKGENSSRYFTQHMIIFEPKQQNQKFVKLFFPKTTNIPSRLKSTNKNFIDFISKCLKIDPSIRMSAIQALNHPFMTQIVQNY